MTLIVEQHPVIVIILLGLGLLTTISNYLSIRRFDRYPHPAHWPRVSVLVPARNEARHIEACLVSLLSQDYPDYEVIVLDDHSTDETRRILSSLQSRHPQLRVLEGAPLPPDWLGKHWACHQLARAADGELLLFTDADTRHTPNALKDSVSALLAEDADLLSAFPRQEIPTLGEKLLVPVISFGILSFLPLSLARRWRWPNLSVSIGQFMLFRRRALEAIGGYAAVRKNVVDDVALGRRIIANGLEWRLLDATTHVTCRMYQGFWEAVGGFTKNVFAFFDYRVSVYILAWLGVALAFVEPPAVILAHALGIPFELFPYKLALVAGLEGLLMWSVAYKRFRFPLWLAALYPLSMFLFLLVALRSLAFSITGQATWKDRALLPPAIRW